MEISNFKEKNIIREIDKGAEGIVYLYNDNGNIVAFKKFFNEYKIAPNTNDNKELKIIILKNEEVLKNDIKLLNRMYYMGKFIGFTSVYEPYKPLSCIESKNEKIKVLQSLQDRYEELNKRGIYIGDFNSENFCMTNNGIKLYDIDNYRIDNLNFNITNPPMEEYMKKCKNIKNIDYYCFNYFALSYISEFETDMILRGAAIKDFPRKLKTKEILSFIKSLENINDDTIIEKNKNGKQKTLLNLLK